MISITLHLYQSSTFNLKVTKSLHGSLAAMLTTTPHVYGEGSVGANNLTIFATPEQLRALGEMLIAGVETCKQEANKK